MRIKKLLNILLFCFITKAAVSQGFSEQWTGHFSYIQIKAIAESSTTIYGAAENAIFSYNIATGETLKTSTVNGLSGQTISALYYSEDYKALVVGYENGIIEIVFDDNDDIFTAIDITQKTSLTDTERRINHLTEEGDTLYVSTNFGIIEFNLDRLEFGDTFFIGTANSKIAIAQTVIDGGKIFAASKTSGILIADQNSQNLIDSSIWNNIQEGSFVGIQTHEGNIYAATNDTQLLKYNGTNFVSEVNYDSKIIALDSNTSYLTVTLARNVFSYNSSFNEISTISQVDKESISSFSTATTINNKVYLGTTNNGLYSTKLNASIISQNINPSGPTSNIPRTIDVYKGDLWVAYGQYNFGYAPVGDNKGISNFDFNNKGWTHIPKNELLGANTITGIAINPNNPNQIFFSSYQKGLLEIRNKVPFKLYDALNTNTDIKNISETNPGLEAIVPPNNQVRIHSLFFNQENLWLTNSLITNTAIKKYNPNTDTFSSVDFGSLLEYGDVRFSDLLINENNTLFLGSYTQGVIAHDIGSNRFRKIKTGLDDTADVRAIALDKNDQLWVGAINGLRILPNASNIFQQQNPILNDIVIRQNGINQQILNGEHVWDIKVDGSNNKWVATQDSGVFYFSPDGEETLEHFTTANSPLPSNFVQEIAIDKTSGAVYFATQSGLVQYQGLATESNKNLDKLRAFPNPVRPGYDKPVTIDGLTDGANVKITDIEGNLVFEKTSQGGSIQWDTSAFGRHKVASGVYLIMVTGEELSETKIAKLMIIR